MSDFSKILSEKLNQDDQKLGVPSDINGPRVDHSLSNQLLEWLSGAKLQSKNLSYYIGGAQYAAFKKDPEELKKTKIQRENQAWESFLSQVSSSEVRLAAEFFYRHGGRSFMSSSLSCLKKDYRKLAFSMHPDRHFRESPSVQGQFQENFRTLQISYETLKAHFLRVK